MEFQECQKLIRGQKVRISNNFVHYLCRENPFLLEFFVGTMADVIECECVYDQICHDVEKHLRLCDYNVMEIRDFTEVSYYTNVVVEELESGIDLFISFNPTLFAELDTALVAKNVI